MKYFELGDYKGLEVEVPFNTKAKDVEINEAIRILSMSLDEEEKPLLADALPKVKENIEEKKARLLPYVQMDKVIEAIAEQSQYEFDEEELDALTSRLCDDFVTELNDTQGLELKEYFSLREITPGDLVRECRLEAARRLLTEEIIDAVAKAEGIVVTEDEQKKLADKGNYDLHAQLRAKTMAKLLEYNLS